MTDREIGVVIKRLARQYQKDDHPWYLGFSGGKDSTALFAAVYLTMLDLPRLTKPVTLLYCDTGVEIPVIAQYVRRTFASICRQAGQDRLPIITKIVKPRLKDRFFVKVIGNGYPTPTNKFRWCTDRLRVGPVRRIMRLSRKGQTLMLLGTRWNESPERNRTLARFKLDGVHYFRQAGNADTKIFSPLADLSTKQIWNFLHSKYIPSCLNVSEIVSLYRSANGSNCSGLCHDCPECTGARFGCWICTVVRKDRAVANMVSGGHPELSPLLGFRDWLAKIRDNPHLRHKHRRNGDAGPGPFKMRTRKTILARLRKVEEKTPWQLLSPAEEKQIKRHWEDDRR
jgi:DNA sulfur modification protein DndC